MRASSYTRALDTPRRLATSPALLKPPACFWVLFMARVDSTPQEATLWRSTTFNFGVHKVPRPAHEVGHLRRPRCDLGVDDSRWPSYPPAARLQRHVRRTVTARASERESAEPGTRACVPGPARVGSVLGGSDGRKTGPRTGAFGGLNRSINSAHSSVGPEQRFVNSEAY